jgi:hypothetical protein
MVHPIPNIKSYEDYQKKSDEEFSALAQAIYRIELLKKGLFYGLFIGCTAGGIYHIMNFKTNPWEDDMMQAMIQISTLLKQTAIGAATGSFLGAGVSYLLFKAQE